MCCSSQLASGLRTLGQSRTLCSLLSGRYRLGLMTGLLFLMLIIRIWFRLCRILLWIRTADSLLLTGFLIGLFGLGLGGSLEEQALISFFGGGT